MHKLGRINKSWRRRFFVAAHGQLEYYTGPDRAEKKGTMALVQVRVAPIDAGVFKPPSEFCLEVSHQVSDRRLVLACDGAEEQEDAGPAAAAEAEEQEDRPDLTEANHDGDADNMKNEGLQSQPIGNAGGQVIANHFFPQTRCALRHHDVHRPERDDHG